MRRLLTHWMSCGTALLAFGLMLGCAPATEKPKDHGTLSPPPTDGAPASVEEPSTEKPSEEGAGEVPTPEEDAKEEMKDEEKAAGKDPLDTSSDDPNVKTGDAPDPVYLK